jgi:hypothetical protein
MKVKELKCIVRLAFVDGTSIKTQLSRHDGAEHFSDFGLLNLKIVPPIQDSGEKHRPDVKKERKSSNEKIPYPSFLNRHLRLPVQVIY